MTNSGFTLISMYLVFAIFLIILNIFLMQHETAPEKIIVIISYINIIIFRG